MSGSGNEGSSGDGNEDRSGDRHGGNNREGGRGAEKESSGIRHIKNPAGYKIRRCHSARGTIFVDRRWFLQVAKSFGRNTRRLSNEVLPKGELGTRNEGGNEGEDEDEDGYKNITRG